MSFDAGQVVWEGRPTVGIVRQDLFAGAATFLVCLLFLGGGLTLAFQVQPAAAVQVAALYAAFVAGAVTFARAIGASARIHGALAGFLGATTMAGFEPGEGLSAQVTCSVLALIPVGVALAWRLRQRLRTRYRVTPRQVTLGEEGRYLITFSFSEAPRVSSDPLGGDLGEVSFRPAEAQLVTHSGKVFKMPGRVFRLHRIRHPERLLAALAGYARSLS